MASTASFFTLTPPQSHNNWRKHKPNQNPYKNLHFLSNQTATTTPSSSVSFPLNIIKSNTAHLYLYRLHDSTDGFNIENDANLLIPTGQNHQIIHQESRPRIFIQDPPWISSLFLKGLYKITLRTVKLEHQEIEKHKYNMLRRRQIKEETEAWERMVIEYKELEREMCEKRLAPNLPYVKSLFLGWFEPLREAIEREQKAQRSKSKKVRAAYAPHIDLLPAEKMAVIVMHKMMGLVMAAHEDGCVQLVQAAIHIGQAIEHEVRPCLNVFEFFKNAKPVMSNVMAEGVGIRCLCTR